MSFPNPDERRDHPGAAQSGGTPPSGADEAIRDLLITYVQTRRPEIRERIIVLHLDLVSRLARQLAGRGPVLDDLIQVGYIGLMKAIDRFDPERQIAFVAYAIPTIAGEMKRYLRDKEPIIHVPRQVQEQRVGVRKVADRLAQQLGRPPTDAEIAAAMGIETRKVQDARASELARPVSLDRPVHDDDEVSVALADLLSDDDDLLKRSEDRLLLERAFAGLSPRQRAILYLLFQEDLSQAQIGERLSISQMQVSRLSRAALARLRQGLEERGTGG